ncbi:MAG TPA: alpha/beta hydrolase [Saprospiraceae bacterium]|nr:alpha/beta hydrolase [Saprospiraceae bacterium]HMQ83430.1 alpha/beta hydrolase [Saprospiraceae bacterium]
MKEFIYQGASIAYHTKGKGEVILLLHGFCEDSGIWEEFQTEILEEGHRVVRIDLPGFGQSAAINPISIEEMADLVKALMDHLQIAQFIFIGHSMGGYIALAFAQKYPSYLKGLGLFHSQPYADSEEKKANRKKSIEFIQRQGTILFVKQLIPNLFAEAFVKSNSFLLDKLVYRATQYPAEGIMAAQQAMIDRVDHSETLARVNCPVLFIVGKEDKAIPSENSMEQLHLPQDASIHVLEKVGHMGMFEAKRSCQTAIKNFAAYCRQKTSGA